MSCAVFKGSLMNIRAQTCTTSANLMLPGATKSLREFISLQRSWCTHLAKICALKPKKLTKLSKRTSSKLQHSLVSGCSRDMSSISIKLWRLLVRRSKTVSFSTIMRGICGGSDARRRSLTRSSHRIESFLSLGLLLSSPKRHSLRVNQNLCCHKDQNKPNFHLNLQN